MKILLHSLILLIAAGIGLGVGFAWRGKPGGRPAHTEERATASTLTNERTELLRSTKSLTLARAHDDSPLATQLERDLSLSSGVTRWLYWLEAVEKAAPSDFPRLARLAQGNATATKLLAARWVEMAPRQLFDTLAAAKHGPGFPADELATVLFEEWPQRDADAVIAALSETNHPGMSSNWRWTVAYKLIRQDMERGLRLMSEWNVNDIGFGPGDLEAIAQWTRANPRHAAEFMMAQPAGHTVRSTMATIGQEWAKTDPASALEFASAKTGGLGVALADAVLKNWAERNLTAAADWLAATDASTRQRLSPAFVEALAKQDVSGALAWCEGNLTGNSLAQAVGGVSKGAAERDVMAAAGLVNNMKPSAARAEAAAGVAQKWFPDSFAGKTVPLEAIKWLESLDAASVKRVLENVHFRWTDSDPKSLAVFLATTTSPGIPKYMYSSLARNLARQNPVETLDWAAHLPEAHGLAVGGDAFAEWRRAQPEAATKWLNELPANDPRRPVFFEKEIQSLAHDLRAPAAEQLAALSPHDRTIAREVIAKMNLPEDRRTKLLEAITPR